MDFRTNGGNFTNKFIIPKNPNIVVAVDTFLNKSVPEFFGSIKGYSKWYRKERIASPFFVIALFFRKTFRFSN